MVKGYLSLRGVEFIVKNVSTDLEGRAELIAIGFDSTPVTIIGEQQLSGFDIPTIDKALADLKSN
ncbi:MAG: glutaredoxin family protein [Chloroflexi bacterium]|jgi:glutaredoxin 3|nr:glutaredoxin family protein [Chloroflexota bacterium]